MKYCVLERILKFLNYVIGTAVVVGSLYLFFAWNKIIPLYIALAVLAAGPFEDFLSFLVKQYFTSSKKNDDSVYLKIVDYSTSLIFLILLGLASLEAYKLEP